MNLRRGLSSILGRVRLPLSVNRLMRVIAMAVFLFFGLGFLNRWCFVVGVRRPGRPDRGHRRPRVRGWMPPTPTSAMSTRVRKSRWYGLFASPQAVCRDVTNLGR